MIQVSLVPPQMLNTIWSKVENYMAASAEYTYGRYTVDDIKDTITDYDHHLWIAFDDKKNDIEGAVVTNFITYPRKKALSMVFCGGRDVRAWKDQMISMLQAWAFDNNCDVIECTGRPGWVKILSENGHSAAWHTFEIPAGKAGLGEKNG
jgi:hypothetical protein